MKARVKWVEDRTFVGESGSGHKVVLGTAFGEEGRTPGPSPMELVLIGTGGCSAYDVVHILEKGREPVEDCVVELDAREGQLEGYVKPLFHNLKVVTLQDVKEDNPLQLFWEALVGAAAEIASSKASKATSHLCIVVPCQLG